MRKCDICGTNIPFSTDRCPNCGYQYKPERKIDGYMSQFQPHPSPLDDLKKTTKTITPKNYSSNHSMMKYIGIIVPVISLIVMVSIFVTQISSKIFDLSSPSFSTGELETYYLFYHYEDLSSNFEEVASEVKPYYVYAQSLHDQYCEEGYVMYEEYLANDEVLDYATMDTTLLIDEIYVGYSLYKISQYDEWQENIAVTSEGENQEAIRVMADFIGVDYNSLYTFYQMSDEGFYQYFIEDGYFCVDKFDNNTTLSYCREIKVTE